jgi:hypothetical protein
MTEDDIPILPPSDITPDWITRVLSKAGHRGVVEHLTARRVGTGQVGESYRFELTYAGDAGGSPATLVGKFPASDPVSRSAGVNFGNYVREVNFYRELQASALVSTPLCLHADVDVETCDFVLIMEDLAPAEAGDQTRGVSVDAAALALGEAAKLHASHWQDPAIEEMAWISDARASPRPVDQGVIGQLWRGFLDRYGDRVKPNCLRIGEAVVANYGRFRSGYTGPKCLVHMDFRPDNMMFGTAAGGRPITVVDWQSLGLGCCMGDVAYFLAGAISREERRANERALLSDYHRQLLALGVTDYSFDDLWRDYAACSFALFNMGFTASMVVERTPRGDDMFFQMLETGAALVEDLDAVRLLEAP